LEGAVKDTKDLILDTAFTLFMNNNYESVTFTELCRATKLTKGAVYHYFSSKEELFKAVIDKYVLLAHNKSQADSLALDQLIKFKIAEIEHRMQNSIVCKLDKYNSAPLNYIQLLFLSYKYYPDFKKIGDAIMVSEIEIWNKAISNSIKQGVIRNDIDVETTAFTFIAIITNLVLRLINTNSENHLEIIEKQLNGLYRLLKI
jgi:TetR/AcrR family transcriptional regulator, transcriptional repressor for nem operon